MISRLSLFVLATVCSSAFAQHEAFENVSNWMLLMKDVIYPHSLLQIPVPGSHDSGTYQLFDQVAPGNPEALTDIINIAGALHLPVFSFIREWSQTQDLDFYNQMMLGIRYIDIRPVFAVQWYTSHFLIGNLMQNLLADIGRFMASHPGEVTYIQIGDLAGSDFTSQLALAQMIETALGAWLCPRNAPWMGGKALKDISIGLMVQNSARILLTWDGLDPNLASKFNWLYDSGSIIEGSYADSDNADAMIAWNVGELAKQGGHNKIFQLSWTITVSTSDIEKHLFDPFSKIRTLRDLSLQADNEFAPFWAARPTVFPGNVVMSDWFNYMGLMNYILNFNLRNCLDDYDYIAVNPQNQYCRMYASNGNCTNAQYKDWMATHCRLSCGVC